MPCIDLEVPYHDKELAKAAGARWDAQRKVWYVVDFHDLTPLKNWLPRPSRINHRADSCVLLESRRDCWHCGRETRVFGFSMPSGHERLEETGPNLEISNDVESEAGLGGPDAIQWAAQDAAAVLSYVTHISEAALSRMHSLTMRYRKDYSGVTGTRYFMNHCEHCDAKLGDFETIEEFDAPLCPIGTESASKLVRYPIKERVEAGSSSTPLSIRDVDCG